MGEKPKIDHKAQQIYDELARCSQKYGDAEGRPSGFEPYKYKGGFRPANLDRVTEDEFELLRAWLDTLQEEPLAYSALLQIWLNAHHIPWPNGVFEADLSLPGRGRRANDLGWRAKGERESGKTWPEVAETLIPTDYGKHPRTASEKVRKAAGNLKFRVDRVDALDSRVSDLGFRMLNIQRDEDILREALGDDYNAPEEV